MNGIKRNMTKKNVLLMVIGIMGMAFFLSFMKQVHYGTDPCSFMNTSLAARFGISFGTVVVLAHLICFVPVLIWGRKYIGLGTIVNMTALGYMCDFWTMVENRLLPAEIFHTLPWRPVIFAVTLFFFLVCAALYMNADMGLVPYDAVPTIISEHVPVSFTVIRIAWDTTATLIAMAAGGRLTVATVLLMFTVGPMVTTIGRILKKA